jgi:predicted nucleotide-binding protein (sugar kinase/HSP70/actin superfamily)
MLKVGIPRALSYYRYFPLFKTLLEGLETEVVLSRPTGKRLLEDGVRHCVDDICVPVKLFYGHVLELKERVDRLFISRLVSVEKCDSDTYTCPKLIGLPDMIRSSLEGLPPIIDFVIDVQNRSLRSSVRRLGEALNASPALVKKAFSRSLDVQARFDEKLLAGFTPDDAMKAVFSGNGSSDDVPAVSGDGPTPDLNIALVGHEYLLHDHFISHNLPGRLSRLGCDVTYMTQVPPDVIEAELARYPGISWSYEKELLGAASHFLHREDIDGVMFVVCFACGPDSIVGEIIEREVRTESSPPLTTLVLDEHTGQAGVATRVEAFVDLIRRSRGTP